MFEKLNAEVIIPSNPLALAFESAFAAALLEQVQGRVPQHDQVLRANVCPW